MTPPYRRKSFTCIQRFRSIFIFSDFGNDLPLRYGRGRNDEKVKPRCARPFSILITLLMADPVKTSLDTQLCSRRSRAYRGHLGIPCRTRRSRAVLVILHHLRLNWKNGQNCQGDSDRRHKPQTTLFFMLAPSSTVIFHRSSIGDPLGSVTTLCCSSAKSPFPGLRAHPESPDERWK